MNPDVRIVNKKFLTYVIEVIRKYDICIASPVILHARSELANRIQWLVGLIDITGTAYMGAYSAPTRLVEDSRMHLIPSPWATFALAIVNVSCLKENRIA